MILLWTATVTDRVGRCKDPIAAPAALIVVILVLQEPEEKASSELAVEGASPDAVEGPASPTASSAQQVVLFCGCMTPEVRTTAHITDQISVSRAISAIANMEGSDQCSQAA